MIERFVEIHPYYAAHESALMTRVNQIVSGNKIYPYTNGGKYRYEIGLCWQGEVRDGKLLLVFKGDDPALMDLVVPYLEEVLSTEPVKEFW